MKSRRHPYPLFVALLSVLLLAFCFGTFSVDLHAQSEDPVLSTLTPFEAAVNYAAVSDQLVEVESQIQALKVTQEELEFATLESQEILQLAVSPTGPPKIYYIDERRAVLSYFPTPSSVDALVMVLRFESPDPGGGA